MKKAISNSIRTTKYATREDNKERWLLIDADGKTLGRLASKIAKYIMGKNNPMYTPNADLGDWVVVINADKVRITGKRAELKEYLTHSMYPGGQKVKTYKELMDTNPERIIELAVKRMLPKTKLGTKLLQKLNVYKGTEHPHKAQNPIEINL
jgi:large subunit ribosomal protein L13